LIRLPPEFLSSRPHSGKAGFYAHVEQAAFKLGDASMVAIIRPCGLPNSKLGPAGSSVHIWALWRKTRELGKQLPLASTDRKIRARTHHERGLSRQVSSRRGKDSMRWRYADVRCCLVFKPGCPGHESYEFRPREPRSSCQHGRKTIESPM